MIFWLPAQLDEEGADDGGDDGDAAQDQRDS